LIDIAFTLGRSLPEIGHKERKRVNITYNRC
jgi:hypothetical protein